MESVKPSSLTSTSSTEATDMQGLRPSSPCGSLSEPLERAAEGSDVAAFYRGRGVLVTGASGFMGKVLVEKLLRSCPDVHTVFLLLRPCQRRGLQPADRLRKLLALPLFDVLRRERPSVLDKVVAVAGDVVAPGLGLAAVDRSLLADTVSIVFHVAANVHFTEHVRGAFDVNVRGTRSIIQLCREIPALAALVYVSTAYCNSTRQRVDEKVYPAPAHLADVEAALLSQDDAAVERDISRLRGDHPNSYTFTKALAESVLEEEGAGLPLVIVRPSIVCPAWREPLPGWVDNVNGPMGPWLYIGMGTLRCLFGDPSLVADLVPVDVCINLMVAAAWDVHANGPASAPGVVVYHSVSGFSNPVTWGKNAELWVRSVRERPIASAAASATASAYFTRSHVFHDLCTLTGLVVPAHAADLLARLTGRPPPGLVSQLEKQRRHMHRFEYFMTHEWSFAVDNVRALWSRMGAADRRDFNFDLTSLDWADYMAGVLAGAKTFLLREKDSDLGARQSRTRARL